MTVNFVIDTLNLIKDRNRANLSTDQIDALNYACNMLESHFGLQEDADAVIERGTQ